MVTVQVQKAFKALDAKMRFFRDRYFKIPPLSLADWAALGFRNKDTEKTKIPPPQGTPAVSLSYPGGPHVMTAHLGPLAGTWRAIKGPDPESSGGVWLVLHRDLFSGKKRVVQKYRDYLDIFVQVLEAREAVPEPGGM
ncbi:MAG: hypothetical protein LBC31_00355 [Treponema sp.]|nr:hypothetical protein [Treponema sp.]